MGFGEVWFGVLWELFTALKEAFPSKRSPCICMHCAGVTHLVSGAGGLVQDSGLQDQSLGQELLRLGFVSYLL